MRTAAVPRYKTLMRTGIVMRSHTQLPPGSATGPAQTASRSASWLALHLPLTQIKYLVPSQMLVLEVFSAWHRIASHCSAVQRGKNCAQRLQACRVLDNSVTVLRAACTAAGTGVPAAACSPNGTSSTWTASRALRRYSDKRTEHCVGTLTEGLQRTMAWFPYTSNAVVHFAKMSCDELMEVL
jgi:hypothetical protein